MKINFKKNFLALIAVIFVASFFLASANAQQIQTTKNSQVLQAKIINILQEKEIKPEGAQTWQLYQKLQLEVLTGQAKGEKIIVENGSLPLANVVQYQTGDRVLVSATEDFKGNQIYFITDYVRTNSLLWLFVIFVILTIIVGRIRGLLSIIGMIISFVVIFTFILPQISAGQNPVKIAILGCFLIIPFSFFLSHGFNKKTLVAIAGTVIALIITGFLAFFFVEWTRLTGFSSEEASFLQVFKQGNINIKGLLLAGIIIGVLGVLDDITVSQSAIVYQLKKTNPQLNFKDLYLKAMDVGQDHIASMVNTLVLVYTGAAMPLLILFLDNSRSFSEVINYEIIADEIVRTLVGSIGLILAVPITTIIAAYAFSSKNI